MLHILSRILCFLGAHDWREMDGYCRECGKRDEFQFPPYITTKENRDANAKTHD